MLESEQTGGSAAASSCRDVHQKGGNETDDPESAGNEGDLASPLFNFEHARERGRRWEALLSSPHSNASSRPSFRQTHLMDSGIATPLAGDKSQSTSSVVTHLLASEKKLLLNRAQGELARKDDELARKDDELKQLRRALLYMSDEAGVHSTLESDNLVLSEKLSRTQAELQCERERCQQTDLELDRALTLLKDSVAQRVAECDARRYTEEWKLEFALVLKADHEKAMKERLLNQELRLRQEMHTLEEQLQLCKQELAALQEQYKSDCDLHQQTSKELLGCKKKLEASEGALVSLRSEMEGVSGKLEEAMVAYEQRVVKSKALKASMKEVNVHLEQQRAENTALSRQCNAATADAQDLRVRVEALTTERAKWEEDLAHARFAEEEARSLHAGASQECNRIKEDLASAHEAARKVSSQLLAAERRREQEEQAKSRLLLQAENKAHALQREWDDLNASLSRCKERLAESEKRAARVEAEQRCRSEELMRECAVLEKALEQSQDAEALLRAQMRSMSSEAEQKLRKVEQDMERERAEAQEHIAAEKRRLRECQHDHEARMRKVEQALIGMLEEALTASLAPFLLNAGLRRGKEGRAGAQDTRTASLPARTHVLDSVRPHTAHHEGSLIDSAVLNIAPRSRRDLQSSAPESASSMLTREERGTETIRQALEASSGHLVTQNKSEDTSEDHSSICEGSGDWVISPVKTTPLHHHDLSARHRVAANGTPGPRSQTNDETGGVGEDEDAAGGEGGHLSEEAVRDVMKVCRAAAASCHEAMAAAEARAVDTCLEQEQQRFEAEARVARVAHDKLKIQIQATQEKMMELEMALAAADRRCEALREEHRLALEETRYQHQIQTKQAQKQVLELQERWHAHAAKQPQRKVVVSLHVQGMRMSMQELRATVSREILLLQQASAAMVQELGSIVLMRIADAEATMRKKEAKWSVEEEARASHAQHETKTLKEAKGRLQLEGERLSGRCAAAEAAAEELREEIAREREAKLEALMQVGSCKEELAGKRTEVSDLNVRLVRVQGLCSEHQALAVALKAEQVDLEHQVSRALAGETAARESEAKMSARCSEMEKDLRNAETRARAAEEELESLRVRADIDSSRNTDALDRLRSLELEILEAHDREEQLRQEAKEAFGRDSEQHALLDDLRKDLQALEALNKECEARLEREHKKWHERERAWHEQEKRWREQEADQVAVLRRQNEDLSWKMQEAQEEAKAASQKADEMFAENEELRHVLDEQVQEREKQSAREADREQEREQEREKDRRDREQDREELTREKEELAERLQAALGRESKFSTESTKQVQVLEETVKKLHAEKLKLHGRLEELEMQKMRWLQTETRLTAALQEKEEKSGQLRTALERESKCGAESTKQVQMLEETVKKLHGDKLGLHGRLEKLEMQKMRWLQTETRLTEALRGYAAREQVLMTECHLIRSKALVQGMEERSNNLQLAKVVETLEHLEAENQDMTSSLSRLQADFNRVENDDAGLHAQLLVALQSVRELQAEKDRLQRQQLDKEGGSMGIDHVQRSKGIEMRFGFRTAPRADDVEESSSSGRFDVTGNSCGHLKGTCVSRETLNEYVQPYKEELQTVHTLVGELQAQYRKEIDVLQSHQHKLMDAHTPSFSQSPQDQKSSHAQDSDSRHETESFSFDHSVLTFSP